MSQQRLHLPMTWMPLFAALLLLLAVYIPALQRIPNGSEHYYMIDVGETQIVLNTWGTLHATGYPLYVMIGNTAVTILKAFGVGPAAAPGVVSLLWGLGALTLIYCLALKVSRRPLAAAALIVLFGMTRTVWIHHDIAEIYTMTLFLLALMLLVALWTPRVHGRVYWLALIGGIAVFHHRALAIAVPALIFAVYPDLIRLFRPPRRRVPVRLALILCLGLIGLLPYAYMMLRAHANAPYVYGEPGTLSGLWDQFIGKEASRFIGMPGTGDALIANIRLVCDTILTDVSVVGAFLGIVGLIVGAVSRPTRRPAITLILSGGAAFLFHCFFYTDILSALILAVTLSLAFGWFLLLNSALHWVSVRRGSWRGIGQIANIKTASPNTHLPPSSPPLTIRPLLALDQISVRAFAAGVALIFGLWLYTQNQPFVVSLTTDRTGIETIALAQHAPPGSTLMLAWGPRYFAAAFARSVMGALPGVELVTHKADFRALAADGMVVTPAYTFYRQSQTWWEAQLGGPVYLRAVAPELVQIATMPERAPIVVLPSHPEATLDDVSIFAHELSCSSFDYVLEVSWLAKRKPQRDLSVFVHLLDSFGTIIAQADQSAPVYGWRPLSSWSPGEIVRDVYTLPRLSNAASIHYGLYMQHEDGSFENALEVTVPADCSG